MTARKLTTVHPRSAHRPLSGFIRIPGLFRRSELEPLDTLEPGFQVESAGTAPDGTDLVAVYQRDRQAPRPPETGPVSVEVVLSDDDPHSRLAARYCDVCCRWGQLRSVHLCGVNWHPRLEGLLASIATEGGTR